MLPPRRALKRISNRLAKKGLTFLRIEQNDPQLITMRIVMETKREKLGRCFVYPREWLLKKASPRVIADSVIADYISGYGHAPLGSAGVHPHG